MLFNLKFGSIGNYLEVGTYSGPNSGVILLEHFTNATAKNTNWNIYSVQTTFYNSSWIQEYPALAPYSFSTLSWRGVYIAYYSSLPNVSMPSFTIGSAQSLTPQTLFNVVFSIAS